MFPNLSLLSLHKCRPCGEMFEDFGDARGAVPAALNKRSDWDPTQWKGQRAPMCSICLAPLARNALLFNTKQLFWLCFFLWGGAPNKCHFGRSVSNLFIRFSKDNLSSRSRLFNFVLRCFSPQGAAKPSSSIRQRYFAGAAGSLITV